MKSRVRAYCAGVLRGRRAALDDWTEWTEAGSVAEAARPSCRAAMMRTSSDL